MFYYWTKTIKRKKSEIFNNQSLHLFLNSIVYISFFNYCRIYLYHIIYFCVVDEEAVVDPSWPNCDKKLSPDSNSEQP